MKPFKVADPAPRNVNETRTPVAPLPPPGATPGDVIVFPNRGAAREPTIAWPAARPVEHTPYRGLR